MLKEVLEYIREEPKAFIADCVGAVLLFVFCMLFYHVLAYLQWLI